MIRTDASYVMRCARCNEESPPHAKFCEQCGTRLARPCSSGGAPLSLGEVTACGDSPEHADGHHRDALALAEELEMRLLAAHCHLGLGKLYRQAAAA